MSNKAGMAYEDADNAYFSILEKYSAELFKIHQRSRFPNTYRAMLGFVVKLNSLKNAMYDMVETNNPYAFNAIFRCYCDHFLKLSYIFFRFLLEDSDAVGSDYFNACGSQELHDYLTAIRAARAIVDPEEEAQLRKTFRNKYSHTTVTKDLAATAAKFKYRAIIRYIAVEVPAAVSRETPFLALIIPRFAELSAFVHGGPHGDEDMANYGAPSAIADCRQELDLALAMTMSSLLFTSMAISREFGEFRELSSDINRVLRDWLDAT